MGPLIRRILRQMKNDTRSLAMLLIMPVAIIGLLFLLLGDSDHRPTVALDGSVPAALAAAIGQQALTVVALSGDGDEKLRTGEVDAIVAAAAGAVVIRMAEAGGGVNAKVLAALRAAAAQAQPQPGGKMEAIYLYGQADASLFDNLGYVFLAVISFFVVFVLSGVSFIRERTGGTLERMMLTPVRRYQVVFGYTAGFGLLATVQSLLIVLFCRYVLGLAFAGPLIAAMVIMVLLAFAAVATGTFISIFANNEFQMVQFIPVVLIPQIFFSGLLPVETFPFQLGNLAYLMPIYYGATALNGVMIKGYGLLDNGFYLIALAVYIAALSLLNVAVLKSTGGFDGTFAAAIAFGLYAILTAGEENGTI